MSKSSERAAKKRRRLRVKKIERELTAADLVPSDRGRPVLFEWSDQDMEQISRMAECGLSQHAIAHVMGCSPKTFERRLALEKEAFESGKRLWPNLYVALERARSAGEFKLAATCFDLATKDKHPSMLIWLSKVRLMWRETVEIDQKTQHTVVYETQLADGVLRQNTKELPIAAEGQTIDAMIEHVMDEVCQS